MLPGRAAPCELNASKRNWQTPMVEVQLLDRLRALAHRKRWTIGLAVSSGCRRLHAALLASEGTGLSSRAQVVADRTWAVPAELTRLFAHLRRGHNRSPTDAALLAAQLAECQAILLDEFAAQIAPVWDRILAVAVDDPGLWRHALGLIGYVGLCDAARLAELSGLNVLDAFAARDLAQDGLGRPLSPIPHWILLHDLQKNRVLLQVGRSLRLTYLPASRDASAAARVLHCQVDVEPGNGHSADTLAADIARGLATHFPPLPRVDELVICDHRKLPTLLAGLGVHLPDLRVVEIDQLGFTPGTLRAAGLAVLGLLHLDQTPANATAITGARTPRVLGRLTPGSLPNWHRLLRELAAARPSVVTLRSAV
jgi:1,6-anhydro-N-acetylmuramate kinase